MRTTSSAKPNRIGIRVDDDTKGKLFGLAEQSGVSVSEYIREIIDNVEHNDYSVERKDNNVEQKDTIERLQKQISELQKDNTTKQERIAELEFLNDPDHVNQLENRIKELESQNTVLNLPYDTEIELKDTLRMIELSSSKEQVPLFLKNFHDRLESGEFQIQNGKLKLGYSEVYEVINRAETKKWLKGVWDMCEEKGLDYKVGLRSVFEEGSKVVIRGMGSQQEANYVP